ncbi:PAS domain-containing protein [Flaviaesturariibacter amylovorans]|uniref:histidine kinase n=2 Tax=Flaviaesturariibacter amylovorans TaxID=1084520 RepID=A0ABP8H5L2_9BACT
MAGILIETTGSRIREAVVDRSDARIKLIADTMPQLVWTTLADGFHDFYNRRWYEYTGLTYEKTKGEGWNAVLHPDDRQRAWEVWSRSLQTGADYEIEYRFRRFDGIYRWFLGRALPLRDEKGNIVKWFGTCTDIHEQKIVQQRLEESREEMHALANAMPQLVWMAQPDGTVSYFNDRISLYAGAKWKADGTWTWEGIIHPDDLERTVAAWGKAVQSGKPYEIEYRLRMAGGAYRWHIGRAVPQFDSAGKPVKWYGTCTDIEANRVATENMKLSHERFELIAKATQDAIWDWDLLSDNIWWNEGFRALFGYSEEEIEPTIVSWYSRVHPDDKERVVGGIHEVIDNGGSHWSAEYRFCKKDGSYAVVFDRGYALHDSNGKPYRMLGSMQDITNRKKVEAGLAESEKRFRSLAENAPDLITRHGKDFRYLYVNSKIEALTGIPPQDFIGQSYYDLPIPQELCPVFDEHLARVFRSGEPHEMEYMAMTGQDIYLYSRLVPEFNGAGDVESVLVITTDVTERKKVERAIRESEQRFQNLIREATVGIIVLEGPEMRVGVVNDAYGRLIGRKATELEGKPLFSVIPEAEKAFAPLINGVRESGNPLYLYGQPYSVYDADNVTISGYLNLVYQPYRNESGETVGVMVLCNDVTEQKQSERALKESEEQFRTLANSIPQLAWMADADGSVYWYNERWYEYTGTAFDEMQGWGWEKVHHPDHRERVSDFARKTWAGSEPAEITFPLRRHDGVYRWFLTRIFPLKDADGRVRQWFGTNTDITDQKQTADLLEEKVRERTAQLEARNRELEQFTYVSHHDLQEPLRKIVLFSDMVRNEEKEKLSEASRNRLDRVVSAAKRMSAALRDVLDYASLSKPEVFVPVNLNEVLAGVQTDLELVISEKGAAIESVELPVIEALPHQMQQLFHNLLTNALKFAKPGVAPRIAISSRLLSSEERSLHPELPATGLFYEISVSDNGIGFSPEASEKIFLLFQRLHSKGTYPGTGIGLALCKKVVENHCGKIWATGRVGSGAVFYVLLPATQKTC